MLKKPMKKPGIVINAARCMACYACFMACKDEHCNWDTALSKAQPELGQYWMNIVEWERGDNERRVKTATVPMPCSHCENPACAAKAKDGAVYKREDGIEHHKEQYNKKQSLVFSNVFQKSANGLFGVFRLSAHAHRTSASGTGAVTSTSRSSGTAHSAGL